MSTKRVTRSSTQFQRDETDNHGLPPTLEEEVEINPQVLTHLSQEVKDIRAQMADMQANLQVIANQLRPTRPHRASLRPAHASNRHDFDNEEEEEDDERQHYRQSPHVRRQRCIPPHLEGVKIYFPHFHGRDNVQAFLDWVAKVEQLFESHVVEEEKCVSLPTLSFQGHALNWWISLVLQRMRKGLPEIEYWFDLTESLHARHVPSYYKRLLMDNLQRLQQRSMTIEEDRQKMELYILRAGIEEDEDLTVARLLSGLTCAISIKVEQQHLRRHSHKDSSISYPKNES